jgi:hypothetical protein
MSGAAADGQKRWRSRVQLGPQVGGGRLLDPALAGAARGRNDAGMSVVIFADALVIAAVVTGSATILAALLAGLLPHRSARHTSSPPPTAELRAVPADGRRGAERSGSASSAHYESAYRELFARAEELKRWILALEPGDRPGWSDRPNEGPTTYAHGNRGRYLVAEAARAADRLSGLSDEAAAAARAVVRAMSRYDPETERLSDELRDALSALRTAVRRSS